jgi:hypothetical protein
MDINGQARSLREMEEEAIDEGREFARKRLQEKLQEQANRYGGVFPPQPKKNVASTKRALANAHRSGSRCGRGVVWKGSPKRPLGLSHAGAMGLKGTSTNEPYVGRKGGLHGYGNLFL